MQHDINMKLAISIESALEDGRFEVRQCSCESVYQTQYGSAYCTNAQAAVAPAMPQQHLMSVARRVLGEYSCCAAIASSLACSQHVHSHVQHAA